MINNTKVWINNRIVARSNARISVYDRGFMYGDGAFETMRSYSGVVFRMEDHLARLWRSLKLLDIRSPYSKRRLAGGIYKCLEANGLKGAYVRIEVTRGQGSGGISCESLSKPNTVIVARRFEGYPEDAIRRGISCSIVDIRQNESSPVSGIKSANFLNYVLARISARSNAADEAILLNTKGYVAEAATSNIFMMKKGTLVTPPIGSGIIPGITRKVIIEIAKRLRMKIREDSIRPQGLLNAEEVFLTNSLAEVIPVVKIGRKVIGTGKPGDVTKLLRISYQKQVIREVL